MNYDTHLFIEIIESIQGVVFLRSENTQGVNVRFYQGLKGRLVIIDTTDEDITPSTGIGYLTELGLAHLIASLFPLVPVANIAEEE